MQIHLHKYDRNEGDLNTLKSEAEEEAPTPFCLESVVIEISERRGVDNKTSPYKVTRADVVDDCRPAVDKQVGEVGKFFHLHALYRDIVIIINNDSRHGSKMEEPIAAHQIVAISTANGYIENLQVYIWGLSWSIIVGMNISSH